MQVMSSSAGQHSSVQASFDQLEAELMHPEAVWLADTTAGRCGLLLLQTLY